MNTQFHFIQKKFKDFKNSRHAGVFVFIWSFIFGILVASLISTSPLIAVFIFIIGVGIFFIDRGLIFLLLLIIGLSLGIFRFDLKDFHTSNLSSSVDQKITLEGVVVSEPEKCENDLRFVLESGAEKVLVSTNLYADISYGDKLKVEGKLQVPGVILDDVTGREFDYAKYLSKDDIYYTMSFANAELLEKGKGNKIISFLLKVKESFVNKMKDVLPEPESSLLAGLLVSGKQALPKNILEEFRRAGVVHIVVLSGYNITVIAEFLAYIFGFLTLRYASSASIIGVILFVLMTGATATVVRAAVMALIAVSGKLLGRSYSAPRALFVAGFIMLTENPKILVFDPSFQLSFLATVAMIYVSPMTDRYMPRGAWAKWGISSILSATIATQLFVLPYLLYQIGSISIVSLLSNILILAFVPFTMLLGFVSTLFAYISSWIALPFTYTTHLMLAWILGVAHILGNLSFAQVSFSSFPLWLAILPYFVFILWRFRLSAQSRNSSQHFPNSNS